MIEPRSSFVDADNVRLHYLEWTTTELHRSEDLDQLFAKEEITDDIPIILFHGLGATADSWRLTANYLYQQHTVLAFDLRGHGSSDRPDQGYDLITIAEDTIAGMAKLGFGQVALVGHGWGARVALVLAARHSPLVSHLVLVDCPHVEPHYWPDMTRELFLQLRAPVEAYVSKEAYFETFRRNMQAFWSPEIENIIVRYIHELPDGSVEELLRPPHEYQIRESLWEDRALDYYGKVSCPVLLIPAVSQPLAGEEAAQYLAYKEEFATLKGKVAEQVARVIQRCSVRWMPDTAHDIQLQRPQLLAETILHFLRD